MFQKTQIVVFLLLVSSAAFAAELRGTAHRRAQLDVPTSHPSSHPTQTPSGFPSTEPSSAPSIPPSTLPSDHPTSDPSDRPSSLPSVSPSDQPSSAPSELPSIVPSSAPSSGPSSLPSFYPSGEPSSTPTHAPSTRPSQLPTLVPSTAPTITSQWYVTDWGQSCDSQCQSVGRPCNEEALNLVNSGSRARFVGQEALGLNCPSTANSGTISAPGISTGCLFSWQGTHATCHARTGAIRRFCCCSEDPEDCPVEYGATRTPSDAPSTSPIPTERPSEKPSSAPSAAPSEMPSEKPSSVPSAIPSQIPSEKPSKVPSSMPTSAPTITSQWYVTDWGQSCDSQCQSVGRPCNEEALNLVNNDSRARFVGEEALGLNCPSTANSGTISAPGISTGCLFSWQGTHATCHARTGAIRRFCCCSEDPEDCPVGEVPSAAPSTHPSQVPTPDPSAKPSVQPSNTPSNPPSSMATSTLNMGWSLGPYGSNCQDHCQSLGEEAVCNDKALQSIDSRDKSMFVAEQALGVACNRVSVSLNIETPGISMVSTCLRPRFAVPTCNAAGSHWVRPFCCCSANREDCPVE